MAKEVEIGDEYLTREDRKALALIRESLGQRGHDNARLLILREHAKRIVRVTPEQIDIAISVLDGDGTLKKGVGPLHILSRKFVMEDPGRVIQFRNFLTDLKDGRVPMAANVVPCPVCGTPFPTYASMRNHRTMAHTEAGKKVRAAAKRTRNRKKRNG